MNIPEIEDSFEGKLNKLLAALALQRSAVADADKLAKQPWETNCSFKFDGNPNPLNIQVATLAQLHAVASDLLLKRMVAKEAANLLGVPVPVVSASGDTFDKWVADLKKRAALIQLNEKKKLLDEMETRANQLVSPERRRQLELEALEQMLANQGS